MVDSRSGIRRIEALRRALRAKAKAAGDAVTVQSQDLLALLDEVGRLTQGNDRLRQQNKRMRLRTRRSLAGDPLAGDPLAGDPLAGDDIEL